MGGGLANRLAHHARIAHAEKEIFMIVETKDGSKNGYWTFPFEEMKPGDWFKVARCHAVGVNRIAASYNATSERRYEVNYGVKICVRRIA